MKHELINLLYTYNNSFYFDDEPLGAIRGHEVDINVNIDGPYVPVLKRTAYPASPRAREALEKHIQELIELGVLRQVGHNEEVEVTTPVIINWHNDLPRDAVLKGCNQDILTPTAKKLFRIINQCGIYEYLRMSFGIKNAPSPFQRMMNTIFPTKISGGWLISYLDDIIICSDSWYLHLERLARVLDKAAGVNMKISLNKCSFGFEELKALGHIVSNLSLGIDKEKVEAVLLMPIPQNKKEKMSFLGFSIYYTQHLKDFAIKDKSLYRICDKQTVFGMKQ
ncbi:hypothetical protein O181_018961 [Austropuccinia psidii MF-1]|uniref:Reverse transcriptase domain-containing protein n=1 Tax=Austropuccinia psidii MF-1 TaxID=1389203 RepID=A0A9Q3GTE5_9BASI|nr:hypothetical protein [Austropuccinia psidii MF-1]